MVVKFGVEVYAREADVMTFVASHTSIHIPRLYGVFTEAVLNNTVTYIVQEQVPGTRLEHVFETLSASERDAIAHQLKDVFIQLHSLAGGRTRLEPFGGGSWARTLWFKCFQNDFPMGDDDAHTTRALLTYFLGITSRRYRPGGAWKLDEFLALFDLDRAPIFSHGDLTPWNIMVHNGRISGIVDWAEAGWYPYFWDSFVLDRAASMFWKVPGAQEMLRAALLEFFPEGTEFGIHWNVQSDFYY
ncbi:kinase-like protein [Trametes versicolor FP-101664 SS1]|uniref:kinase-like protein n=1 Tax=Trametes versicolor (strain FP-101664) TaxID=717944 RepID=UPI0004621F4A|nr:kinase-like protein [Trametes versicolor FP-101664 SS1]EIW56351.1 kinase-like protein [Trametes versicolor FP-101664 SS1]